jgi:4-amino-4-deoxy-L-arabinose transferase-like glycosyltransferase
MRNKNKISIHPLLKSFRDRSFLTHKYFYIILAAAIVAIGLFARTYHLSSLPPGVYPDEAVNGTDAITANEIGDYRMFYTNNYGREGLFMNLIALGFKIFGVSVITLKMWSIFFGTLTVLSIILLAREFWSSWRAGLIAGFLYATSFWAINFSRISFRANMLPFVLVFSFYFLFRALRTEKYYDYILAGLFFGLGMHTYIAFRVAPAIFVVLFLAFWITKKKFLRTYWKEISLFAASALLIALPMLLTFYFHPEYFETRSESVSILSPKVNGGRLAQALGISLAKNFGMFNFEGDWNWRHNFPGQPQLEFFIGIFFLAGIIYLLGRFFYLFYRRFKNEERNEELVINALILSWFFVMLLPALLTYEGLPHSLRAIGSLPAAILIAAFAIEKTFVFLNHLKTNKRSSFYPIFIISQIFLIAIIIWSGAVSLKRYFIDWAQMPQIHAAFSRNFKNMALYLNNLPADVPKYVIANAGGQIMEDGLPVSAQVVKLLTHYRTPGITYIRPEDFSPEKIKAPAKIVLMYYSGEIIAKIKSSFPGAYVQKIDPQPGNGTDYFVININ